MTLAVINANIKRVAKNSAALNQLIQDTAVLVIQHVEEHRDANPAMRLVAAIPNTMRRGALVRWFETYSPIAISKKGADLTCRLHKEDSKAYNPFNVDGARANNWFDAQELQNEDIPMTLDDLEDGFERLIKRMEKKLDDGKVLEADRGAFVARLEAFKALASA
jgi:hypothetical protein